MHAIFKKFSCLSAMLGAFLLASAAHADPIIANGGFETGDFSGWTLTQGTGLNVVGAGQQHSGNNAAGYTAYFGEAGTAVTLSQSLATQAGHTYVVKFWLSNLGGSVNNSGTENVFQMLLGGNSVFNLTDKSASDYTEHHVQFTAGADVLELGFSFQHDDAFWLFDDVSITEVPDVGQPPVSVPEPASVLLFGLALGLLVLKRSRR